MNLKFTSFIILLSISFSSIAQIRIVIDQYSEITPHEGPIFISGTMNEWNMGDPDYQLFKDNDGFWQIFLDAQPEGTEIEFKFTRGDSLTIETGPDGEEMANRSYTFGNGQIVHYEIYG